MRRTLVLTCIPFALLAAAPAPAAAPGPDPIEGTWAYGGGLVSVARSGGIFVGRVVRPFRFAVCPHARGERMWTIARVPAGYAGRHQSFDDRIPGCGRDDRVWLPAAWNVSRSTLTLRVARFTDGRPGRCGSVLTVCFTLRRVSPPPGATTAYSWRASVAGAPTGAAPLGAGYEASTLEGAGGFTARDTDGAVVSSSGTAVLTHEYAEQDDVRLRVRVAGAGAYAPDGTASLSITLVESSSPFCFPGEEGTLVVARGRVLVSICGETLQFVRGRPAGTTVTTAVAKR